MQIFEEKYVGQKLLDSLLQLLVKAKGDKVTTGHSWQKPREREVQLI